jgi:phosphopantetheinyl transferase
MPLLFHLQSPDGGVLVGWALTDSSEELLQQFRLTSDDMELLQSFRLEKRRREWLASRLLVKTVTGIDPVISYLPNGKPYLLKPHQHISISHTHDLAVVVLHPDHQVAVDVEMITPRVTKVADRFLHASEVAMIPLDNALLWQTLIWCAKEALYKYYGQQGIDFKQHFRVMLFVPTPDQPFEMATCFDKDGVQKKLTLMAQYTQTWAMVYLL